MSHSLLDLNQRSDVKIKDKVTTGRDKDLNEIFNLEDTSVRNAKDTDVKSSKILCICSLVVEKMNLMFSSIMIQIYVYT